MATVQETLHEIDTRHARRRPLVLAPGEVYYADHEWLWMPEAKRPAAIRVVERLLRKSTTP